MLLFCTIGVQAQLNTDRITAIGRNALFFDDYVLSIQYFNQVIRLKPYLHEPYQLRAIAKIQLGDLNGALQDCNKAIELNPFQPGAFYTRGFVYNGLKRYEDAEADFTQALVFAPENKTYLIVRADVRAKREHYDEALSDIEYLLRREPNSPTLLFEKGIISISRKDTATAQQAFASAIRYDSQNPQNWSLLGVTQLMQEQNDDALNSINKAISLGSNWSGDYLNRGTIYYRMHNYRGALADYDQAIRLAPTDAQCYYNRAVLRQELGDYNQALEDYTSALDQEPDRVEIRYQRATTYMQLRQWQSAIEDLDALIKRYPYFLPSYYLAAQAKTSLGESKDAYRYRQTAYELEQKKDSIRAAQQLSTNMQIAKTPTKQRDRRKEFSTRVAQNQSTEQEQEQEYTSQTRGSIQKKYVDVINEPNVVISYYSGKNNLRQTNYTHALLDRINREHILPAPIYFCTQETPLTADMVNLHFEQIARFSNQIESLIKATKDLSSIETQLGPLYFARAMEFALVQDYISAMDDATRAINTIHDRQLETIITFCRANWRYKQLQYQRATGELTKESSSACVRSIVCTI